MKEVFDTNSVLEEDLDTENLPRHDDRKGLEWLRAKRRRIYSDLSFIGPSSDHSTCLPCLQLTH